MVLVPELLPVFPEVLPAFPEVLPEVPVVPVSVEVLVPLWPGTGTTILVFLVLLAGGLALICASLATLV